jgi:DNA helicase II / ATP-dependent DNA helicase PcrA
MNKGFDSEPSADERSRGDSRKPLAGNPPPSGANAKPSYLHSSNRPQPIEHRPSADFVASDTSQLAVGQKVEHQKFGFGEVIQMEGSAHNPIATVRFELNGEKKIMLNYAKLRIL